MIAEQVNSKISNFEFDSISDLVEEIKMKPRGRFCEMVNCLYFKNDDIPVSTLQIKCKECKYNHNSKNIKINHFEEE